MQRKITEEKLNTNRIYTNNEKVLEGFPDLAFNIEQLLSHIRSRLDSDNIVHIRTNYNSIL